MTHSAPVVSAASPTGTATPQPNASGASFTLTLDENPLAEFVELPEEALEGGLWFSNVLCGVLRGALEMVRLRRPTLLSNCPRFTGMSLLKHG